MTRPNLVLPLLKEKKAQKNGVKIKKLSVSPQKRFASTSFKERTVSQEKSPLKNKGKFRQLYLKNLNNPNSKAKYEYKNFTLKDFKYEKQNPFTVKQIKKKVNFNNNAKNQNKIGVLFELEKKSIIIQKHFRGFIARKKFHQHKILNLFKGNSEDCEDKIIVNHDNNNNTDVILNSKLSDKLETQRDNFPKKNKESLLAVKSSNNGLGSGLSSSRSEVSRVSINSEELNFSEDSDELDMI